MPDFRENCQQLSINTGQKVVCLLVFDSRARRRSFEHDDAIQRSKELAAQLRHRHLPNQWSLMIAVLDQAVMKNLSILRSSKEANSTANNMPGSVC